jgi:hypothetical protein
MEDIAKEDLFLEVNRIRYEKKMNRYEWTDFVNNEYGHKD